MYEQQNLKSFLYVQFRCPTYTNIPPTCTFVTDPDDPTCCRIPQCPDNTTSTNKVPTPAPSGIYSGVDGQNGEC